MNGAIGCTPSSACSRSAGRSSPTSTGRASWPRSSMRSPTCSTPTWWLSSRTAGRGVPARSRQGLPRAGDRHGASATRGWSAARSRSDPDRGLHEVAAWQPGSRRASGRDDAARGHGPPDRGRRRRRGGAVRHPRSVRIASSPSSSCGIADLLTAQVAIALQNADLHARVADSAAARSADRPAQPALLRRGRRDRLRQRPPSRHAS